MTEPTLSQSALEYAGYWLKTERALVDALSSDQHAVRLQALQRAAGYFRVARNMPTAHDVRRGFARLAPALAVLDEPQFRHLTAVDLRDTVRLLRRRLADVYGRKDLLAAATKFLWLLHRDVVVIYDSQVRGALGSPYADYDAFLDRWRAGYASCEDDIRRACTTLPAKSMSLSCGSAVSEGEIEDIAAQEWFRRRVYDIYLWRRGAPSPIADVGA